MNITSPILIGAANATELPSDSVSTFFRAFGASSPDGGLPGRTSNREARRWIERQLRWEQTLGSLRDKESHPAQKAA